MFNFSSKDLPVVLLVSAILNALILFKYLCTLPTVIPGFEPALLPQETICPSVALAKGQIGNIRGQKSCTFKICAALSPTRVFFFPVGKSDKTSRYFRTVTNCDHSNILSGNCEVSNLEAQHHFLLAILPHV